MVCVQTIIHIKGFYDKFVRDDDDHLVAKGVGQAELIAAGDPLSLAQRLATASRYNCCCYCCCCLRVDYITSIIVVFLRLHRHHLNHDHLPVSDHGFPVSCIEGPQVGDHPGGKEDVAGDVHQTTFTQFTFTFNRINVRICVFHLSVGLQCPHLYLYL